MARMNTSYNPEPTGMNVPAQNTAPAPRPIPTSRPTPAPSVSLSNITRSGPVAAAGTQPMPSTNTVEAAQGPQMGAGIQAAAEQQGIAGPPQPPPTVEDVNAGMSDMLSKWKTNIEEMYQSSLGDAAQMQMTGLRAAGNAAANAGLSYGGSFGAMQNQSIMDTQQMQQQAYRDKLAAMNQVFGMGAEMDFQRGMRDEDWARQDDILAGETLADLENELDRSLTAFAQDNGGRSPFQNAAGTTLPLENIDPGLRSLIESAAAAEGVSPEEYYAQMPKTPSVLGQQESQQDLQALRNDLAQRAGSDWGELSKVVGTGDYKELYEEIRDVLGKNITEEELLRAMPGISPTDIRIAKEEKVKD